MRHLCELFFFLSTLFYTTMILLVWSAPVLATPRTFSPDNIQTKIVLDILPDPTGNMGIQEVAAPYMAQQFRAASLYSPLLNARAIWVRIVVPGTLVPTYSILSQAGLSSTADALSTLRERPPLPHASSGEVLHLGVTLPHATLYQAAPQKTGWSQTPVSGSEIILPPAQSTSQTLYLSLAGHPGPWLLPVLHPAASPSVTNTLLYLLWGFLGALALLNTILLFTHNTPWRCWTTLSSLLILLHLTAPVPPSVLASWRDTAVALLPSLALLALGQTGRCLLRGKSPGAGRGLLLYMCISSALTALALLPQASFLRGAFAFWPLLATGFILPFSSQQLDTVRSGHYLWGMALAGTGALIGILAGLSFNLPLWGALAPAIGLALCILLLSCGSSPSNSTEHDTPAAADTELRTFDAQEVDLTAGALLARVSHDLRTPLLAILHAAEAMQSDRDHTLHGRWLSLIQAAGRNLQIHVNDLLDAARTKKDNISLQKIRFNLRHVLEEAHHMAQLKANRRGVQLAWSISPHMPMTFKGDPDRILQMILNLLGNAIRFTDSGSVQLTVSHVQGSADPGHLLFSVSDTGMGIPLENPYAVLADFCVTPGTESGQYGGMGLGLSITCKLAHLMGGVLCLESAPKKGTTVSFSIRLTPAKQLSYDMPVDTDRHPGLVLLADDVASNRQLVAFFLEETPLEIIEARNGPQALHLFHRKLPSLVILDSDMPGMSGPDTVRALRAVESELGLVPGPILGLISTNDTATAQKMYVAGCSAVLERPFSRSALLSAVAETIKHAPSPQPHALHKAAIEEARAHVGHTPPYPAESLLAKHVHSVSANLGNVPAQKAPPAFSTRKQPHEAVHADTVSTPSALTPEAFDHISAAVAALAAPPTREAVPHGPSGPRHLAATPPNHQGSRPKLIPEAQHTPADHGIPKEQSPVVGLGRALYSARQAAVTLDMEHMQKAAGTIADVASQLKLHSLKGIARCVADAAAAQDLDAVRDLFTELESVAARSHAKLKSR